MLISRILGSVLLACSLLTPAVAQDWPTRPVKVIVPYPAGGNAGTSARIVAIKLEQLLGQPFVVENKPGASGLVGSEFVARSEPDGYTMLITGTNAIQLTPLTYAKQTFSWDKDFTTVAGLSVSALVMQVNPKVPATTPRELIELAKTKDLSTSTPGAATIHHLIGELMQAKLGVKWKTVHYRGNAPATNDVIGGHIDFNFDAMITALPQVQAGTLRALAVTSDKRSQFLPDVPTLKESGYDFVAQTYTGVFMPAGTPAPIVAKLQAAIDKVRRDQSVIDAFGKLGVDVSDATPEEFQRWLKKEYEIWSEVIQGLPKQKQ
jgi:tripartite-type tricarboxylate transporter receptor subunit TctC